MGNKIPKVCNTCMELKSCKRVEPKHLGTDYNCDYYAAADDVELQARSEVIAAFGPKALRFEIPFEKANKHTKKQRRRKINV